MPGQTVVIQGSSNLVDWVALQTNVVESGGLVIYVDPEAGSLRQRFYKAVVEP